MIKKYWQKGGKQKRRIILFSFILLIALFVLRDDYQPALLFIRKYIFIILLSFCVLFLGFRNFRKSASSGKRVFILGMLILFFGALYGIIKCTII